MKMASYENDYQTKTPLNNPEIKSDVNLISDHITTAVHTFLVLFVILIVCLCFVSEFSFFTWHPLLLTIGWILFMSEGILAISKNNVFSTNFTHTGKIRIHWVFQILATGMTAAGFAIAVISKNRGGRGHFTTWHGILGLVAIVFAFLASINGILALFNVEMRNYVKPNLSKLFHALCGILAFAFGGACLLSLFMYSNHWFSGRTDDNQVIRWLCFCGLLFSVVWTLVKPLLTSFDRLKAFV